MSENAHDQEPRAYASGIESPVDYPPRRVVSLVPSLTETLFDLDLGDRLIAITDDCVHPADRVQDLPRVGGTKNPDTARIVDMQPDLVLLNDEENRREDAEALRDAGIPIWVTGPRSVFEALNVLWSIMDIFDHAVMIPRVREIERAYDYTMAASRGQAPVRVFAPVWRDPWMTFNGDTYAHDLLHVCGGTNVFAERERQFPLAADLGETDPLPDDDPRIAGRDRRYPRVTLDEVVEAQPEIVLLPSEPYPFFEQDAATFLALDIPAAHHGRVYLIDGTLLTWHGTRVAYALRDLPALFLREAE